MRFTLPAVGIVFDLDVLGNGAHSIELFMKHADPRRLAYCIVASGDVERPQSEIVRSRFDYCVAVSGPEAAVSYVRELFGTLAVPGLAPPRRRVIEQPILDRLGLTEDGLVDAHGCLVTEEWYRIEHERCKRAGWGYAPCAVNYELSADLRAELDQLRRGTSSRAPQPAATPSPSGIVDLRSDEEKQAQDSAAAQGATVGDMHVGYRVISVKDGALAHLSIVMAENVNAERSPKYVVWTLDRRPGGGYRSGDYTDDRAEAQRAFDSRER